MFTVIKEWLDGRGETDVRHDWLNINPPAQIDINDDDAISRWLEGFHDNATVPWHTYVAHGDVVNAR